MRGIATPDDGRSILCERSGSWRCYTFAVHSIEDARARLAKLDRPAGNAARDLTIGLDTIRFEGLSDAFAATLDARWGGFLTPPGALAARILVRTIDRLNAKYPQVGPEQLAALDECRKKLEAE